MSKSDLSTQLLEMANKDLKAAKGMLDPEVFSDEIFGFHVQQALEKLLKSVLNSAEIEFPKTHDLSVLIDLIESVHKDVNDLEPFLDLNSFAVQYRYEGSDSLDLNLDRKDLLEKLDRVFVRFHN